MGRAGKRGADLTEEVARTLTEIVEETRQVDTLVADIAAASKEQDLGITEISKAVIEIDRVTQANSQTAEEASDLAIKLQEQGTMLRGTVQQIELLMMGDGARVVKELQMGQEPRDPAHPAPAALRRPVLHRKASLEPAEIS